MNKAQLKKISEGQLLDVIRVRTAMYTGSRTLTAISGFLEGYGFCLHVHGFDERHPLPVDFHDWVAYRLHFDNSTTGYKNMILERVPDESAAVDRFFELFDEHRARKPNVVAVLEGTEGFEYKRIAIRDGIETWEVAQIPGPQTLVTYTDDPGCFVRGSDPTVPFPMCGYLNHSVRMYAGENARILDRVTYERLLSENDAIEERRRSVRSMNPQ